jgi:hypothetical protein
MSIIGWEYCRLVGFHTNYDLVCPYRVALDSSCDELRGSESGQHAQP